MQWAGGRTDFPRGHPTLYQPLSTLLHSGRHQRMSRAADRWVFSIKTLKISALTVHQVGGISPQPSISPSALQSDDAGHSQRRDLQSDSRALIEWTSQVQSTKLLWRICGKSFSGICTSLQQVRVYNEMFAYHPFNLLRSSLGLHCNLRSKLFWIAETHDKHMLLKVRKPSVGDIRFTSLLLEGEKIQECSEQQVLYKTWKADGGRWQKEGGIFFETKQHCFCSKSFFLVI